VIYEDLERFRRALLGRRFALVKRRAHAVADENGLPAEPEADWEDQAAVQSAAALLDNLSETERRAIADIDAALVRMTRGTYGACARCGRKIAEDRLRAVPETTRCEGCEAAP
jgi:RNA polymerase-binding transcription factor DksA